jgi:hypothetical protein
LYGDDACTFTTCRAQCAPVGDVGDPCNFHGQCASGLCAVEAGWCTDYCTSSDQCPGYCAPIPSGESICFMACESNLDCDPYPATSCVLYTTVEGDEVGVCHP